MSYTVTLPDALIRALADIVGGRHVVTPALGGGVPLHGEVVLSLTRLNELGPVDQEAGQVTAGAGVTLGRVAEADPSLELGVLIASRDSATVGGAVATNAGGVRVLRYGPIRAYRERHPEAAGFLGCRSNSTCRCRRGSGCGWRRRSRQWWPGWIRGPG